MNEKPDWFYIDEIYPKGLVNTPLEDKLVISRKDSQHKRPPFELNRDAIAAFRHTVMQKEFKCFRGVKARAQDVFPLFKKFISEMKRYYRSEDLPEARSFSFLEEVSGPSFPESAVEQVLDKKKMNLINFIKKYRPHYGVLSEIIVVGPYPRDSFFDRIERAFSPAKTYLIADQVSEFSASEIRRNKDNYKIFFAKSIKSSGLVHAKMYLLKWSLPNKEFKRTLFVGSANASYNGFYVNAEVLNVINVSGISKDERIKVNRYFNKIKCG